MVQLGTMQPVAFLLLVVLWVPLFMGTDSCKNVRAVNAKEITVMPDWLQGDTASYDPGFDSSEGQSQTCDGVLGDCDDDDRDESEEFVMESDEVVHGRLLRKVRYYISYGALRADRIPCPPRSGRSYYTSGCYAARGSVRPYHRACTAITRCMRDTG